MAESARSPQEVNAEILSRLDVAAEYEALGVRLKGQPRASGMVSCYAFGREDRSPSAWINIRSGRYGDSGGRDAPAYTMSLWEFAVKVGRFPDWKSARKAYAEKAGVKLGREKKTDDKTDWREKLEFQSWDTPGNNVLAHRWCDLVKPGITVEAIKAAGGQMAWYPCFCDKKTGEKRRFKAARQVIAIPCYGQWFLEADPVAWQVWDITGQQFEVTPKETLPTEPRVMAKDLSVGPTSGTLCGLDSIMRLCDAESREKVELVWWPEGPTCMMALWSTIPPEKRDSVCVVSSPAGATADIHPWQAKLLAGLPVVVVGDCDEAGQIGAAKRAKALHDVAASVAIAKLPWPVEKRHGRDMRDFVCGVE